MRAVTFCPSARTTHLAERAVAAAERRRASGLIDGVDAKELTCVRARDGSLTPSLMTDQRSLPHRRPPPPTEHDAMPSSSPRVHDDERAPPPRATVTKRSLPRVLSPYAVTTSRARQSWRVLHGVSEGVPGVTVDKFGGALLVQSWREPLKRDDVFDLCDAAFGGQLTAGEDVREVWVHPRARLNRDGSSGSGDAGADASSAAAVPGVYRRASWKIFREAPEKGGSELDAFDAFGPDVFGRDLSDPELGHAFKELGLAYTFVPPRRFGDPSLYLDFRPTRRWIGEHARGVRF